jgi:hypothetical protein
MSHLTAEKIVGVLTNQARLVLSLTPHQTNQPRDRTPPRPAGQIPPLPLRLLARLIPNPARQLTGDRQTQIKPPPSLPTSSRATNPPRVSRSRLREPAGTSRTRRRGIGSWVGRGGVGSVAPMPDPAGGAAPACPF